MSFDILAGQVILCFSISSRVILSTVSLNELVLRTRETAVLTFRAIRLTSQTASRVELARKNVLDNRQ